VVQQELRGWGIKRECLSPQLTIGSGGTPSASLLGYRMAPRPQMRFGEFLLAAAMLPVTAMFDNFLVRERSA